MLHVTDDDDDGKKKKMSVEVVCDGHVDTDLLKSDDAFIIDFGVSLYIWIGKGANKAEKREAMAHAVKYLHQEGRATDVPICRVMEGKEPPHFTKLMAAGKKKGKWDATMVEGGFLGRRSSLNVLRDIPDDVRNAKLEGTSSEEEEEEEEAAAEACEE